VRDHDDFRSVRIIAITGSVIAERNPLLAQVDLILRKPFPIEHLLTAISQVMQAPV
jgi:CheY-like chemotaxis protein